MGRLRRTVAAPVESTDVHTGEISAGWQIDDGVAPRANEPVLHKKAADAFFRTPLAELLEELSVTRLIVVGCKTQYCIDTTVRAATSAAIT